MKRYLLSVLSVALVFSAHSAEAGDAEISRLKSIIEENGYGFTVRRTPFTGLSREEMRMMTGFIPPSKDEWESLPKFTPPPFDLSGADVDDPYFSWRDLGAVTAVRDQGICGSCWAFAAISQLESQILIHDGVTMDLSEQQMIDCNLGGKDCDGGNQYVAYQVLRDYGAVKESCIPYTQSDGNICTQELCTPVALVAGWSAVENNVSALKNALLSGPVYTAFSTSPLFNSYGGGCFDYDDMREPDHALVIVGWDDTMCGGAWIVKNHWGTDWGDEGYIYVKYGVSWIGLYASQIQYQPFVELVSPNGGQTIRADSEYMLRWDTGPLAPDSVSLYYGLGGGAPFDIPIVTGLTGASSWPWQVPDVSTESALVLVRAWLDGDVRAIDASDGAFIISQELSASISYPNPFRETVNIPYTVETPQKVTVSVYDLRGGLVRVVEQLDRDAGEFVAEWDGTDASGARVSPGFYFLRVGSGETGRTEKVVLLR